MPSNLATEGTKDAFFATEHTMEHLGLPDALQKNIKLDYYTAGHMMYLQDQDRVSLHNHCVLHRPRHPTVT